MKFFTYLKKKFTESMSWAMPRFDLFVGLACILMMFCSVMVWASWLIGYWCNGIIGTKFDLQSCWHGIGAIGSGVGAFYTLVKANISKYEIDSKLNSKKGEMPSCKNKKE